MNFIEPWNVVFLLGLLVYCTIRGIYEARAKKHEVVANHQAPAERGLLALVFSGSLLLPLAYLFTPLLDFADLSKGPLAPWAGLSLMVFALWLFWRSHADLGQHWSVTLELRAEHRLAEHGVYRFVRHRCTARSSSSAWPKDFSSRSSWSVGPRSRASYRSTSIGCRAKSACRAMPSARTMWRTWDARDAFGRSGSVETEPLAEGQRVGCLDGGAWFCAGRAQGRSRGGPFEVRTLGSM